MMTLAALIAIACGVGGLYLSYYASVAGGASVAAMAVAAFLLALAGRGAQTLAGARQSRQEPLSTTS